MSSSQEMYLFVVIVREPIWSESPLPLPLPRDTTALSQPRHNQPPIIDYLPASING